MKISTVLWISSALVALTGCANSKDKVFRNNMPSMKEIYENKFGNKTPRELQPIVLRTERSGKSDLVGVAKEHYRILSQEFPILHNPVLITYVYPHITQGGTPIPGYVTYFRLFETDQIAEPGELSEGRFVEIRNSVNSLKNGKTGDLR